MLVIKPFGICVSWILYDRGKTTYYGQFHFLSGKYSDWSRWPTVVTNEQWCHIAILVTYHGLFFNSEQKLLKSS